MTEMQEKQSPSHIKKREKGNWSWATMELGCWKMCNGACVWYIVMGLVVAVVVVVVVLVILKSV